VAVVGLPGPAAPARRGRAAVPALLLAARGHGPAALAAAAVAAAALAFAPPALARSSPSSAQPAPVLDLHRPGIRSHFAFVDRRVVARAAPSPRARRLTRLKLVTEDGTDELVAVLARTRDARSRPWLKVRLPVRPNNLTGWVPETALGPLHLVRTWLKIDTGVFRITLVKRGRTVFRARIGVGEARWPTPRGEYYIRSRLTGYGAAGSFYGPLAFGTSAHSEKLTDWPAGGIVGIHGTSLPHLIPGRISHGCVRLRNPDILRLDELMPVGTPITIT
jgi:lipoprotein-anchoring transpeptidase ErfK/SrfK